MPTVLQCTAKVLLGRNLTNRCCPCTVREFGSSWSARYALARPPTQGGRRFSCGLTDATRGTVAARLLPNVPVDILKFLHKSADGDVAALSRRVFLSGGKLVRPNAVLLMSELCNRAAGAAVAGFVSEKQYKIAMVAEMIHVASLVHDDIVDEADTRRGVTTVNESDGCSRAVFLGDYILAQATCLLTTVDNPEVIRILSQVIDDLVRGELMQAGHLRTEQSAFAEYMQKTYRKTGSLFSNSLKAVAELAGCSDAVKNEAMEFGRNFGMLFQLVDDLLDFTATSEALGKPVGADLMSGLVTGPVLFAARQFPEILEMVKRGFEKPADFERCMSLVLQSDGLLRTKQLAQQFATEAVRCLSAFPDGVEKSCLLSLCEKRLGVV